MKKTLTVNLGGTVYHIDEDAYKLLDNYLNNLRYHFRKEEGAEEIVHDMETRIAELFDEYIACGKQVITVLEVEEVIARMGQPEELNEPDEAQEASAGGNARQGGTSGRSAKRLFRNPDDRILGGVISGLSAYFGWDATWVRIGTLVVGCFVHFLIVAYLIAWVIIPLARTATEKLQMRGEPINMENIGRTVTDGFEKVSNGFERVNEYVHSEKPRSFLHQLGGAIVAVAGFLIKVCLVIFAILCAPVLFAGLVVMVVLMMVATGLLVTVPAAFCHLQPEIDWSMVPTAPWPVIGFAVCGLFVVGIPIIGLLQLVMQSFNVWTPMATSTKIMLTILWILSLVVGLFLMWDLPFIYL